jgi:60 kDa SS-A/Ro ribonucleoprotein
MKTNLKGKAEFKTHEGAPSPGVSSVKELRRAVMACMLWEDQFYESGESIADRIKTLVSKVAFKEAAQVAIDAREKFKLRHVPLLVLREMLRKGVNHRQGREMGELITRVIQRADEMGELLSIYWKDGKDQPLPAQLKIGLARAFKKFPEYQLAKYNRDAAVKIRDVMFLVHPRPNNEKQTELFKRVAADTMVVPDTWEVALSAGGDKKEEFTRLLNQKKLGALALLRNLRNMIESGVDEDLIRRRLGDMNAERVLPFRFITAAKYAPRLEDALEDAMFKCLAGQPKLGGKTALLVDHSASMNSPVSTKSEISRFDSAAALAMVLREVTDRCRVFTFSDRCVEIAPRRGFGMLQALNAVRHPASTMLGSSVKWIYQQFPECDRVIVITDEQSADRPPHPQGTGYIINVAGNKQGIAYGPWVSIDGWSEAVLDYIKEYENQEQF